MYNFYKPSKTSTSTNKRYYYQVKSLMKTSTKKWLDSCYKKNLIKAA